ncbi:DUF3160 domain-containing protein [candidate division WOR-3 bacterium]|uniref:DUF3160 domain-containing protein n=1 Tax=candidate division WOR-3 bacterium TaxID=2052148 RepID=A0A9D5KAF3_UNCW3|nr:DUF3160 domain-containing protein [candidate division WOR-3 bacterium]MBD3364594.1 DUF3160 domain-containing protein [candidate division WOR-3 bacterium]
MIITALCLTTTHAGRLGNFDPRNRQPDLEDILSKSNLEKVDSLGFVFYPTKSTDIYAMYENLAESQHTPLFVSADLILHTFHVMFAHMVETMEAEELLIRLEDLTAIMCRKAEEDYKTLRGKARDAARIEYLYFAVGAKLLDLQSVNYPEGRDAEILKTELAKIEEHSGMQECSFLPGVIEDYTQYQPRGHYTKAEHYERYFKAMMWFGRIPLHVPAEGESLDGFRAALLISINLKQVEHAGRLWNLVYVPTSFFFGSSEDLSPDQLYLAAKRFLGETPSVKLLKKDDELRELAAYLREKIKPRILSEYTEVLPEEEPGYVPLSFRFFPQRFVLDSYVFSELVGDRVGAYTGNREPRPFTCGMTELGEMRVFPRGLDLLAVMNNDEAFSILASDGDAEYEAYDEQLSALKRSYASTPEEMLRASVYSSWFKFARAYSVSNPPEKVHEQAWERKKLLTTLGSWAQLKHDAVLYGKQSYTAYMANGDYHEEPEPAELAYLEDAPLLYRKIAECALSIAAFSHTDWCRNSWQDFAKTLDEFERLTGKQRRQGLSEDEYLWLRYAVEDLSVMAAGISLTPVTEDDKRMAQISDVHTDPNTAQVLEEASGNPARLLVLVDFSGRLYVAQGAAFTYYEFKQPLSDRLTDEKWWEMLEKGEEPEMPAWSARLWGVSSPSVEE